MRIEAAERFAFSLMYGNTLFRTKTQSTFRTKKVDSSLLVRLHWSIQNSACTFNVPMCLVNFPMLNVDFRSLFVKWSSPKFHYIVLRCFFDRTDLKENLMKQLSVKWLYSVVDVFLTVFFTLTAFLFHVSPFIYQCNYRAAKKFCWNPLFSPLSAAFCFSNWHLFYIPWLPINSSKEKVCLKARVYLCIYCAYGLF